MSYNIAAVTGATSYTWSTPQSSSVSSGQGSTEVAVNMGPHAGNITVKANSTCGSSAVHTIAVAFTSCFAGSGTAANTYSLPELRPVPEVISSYGGFATAGAASYEWTAGEARVESRSSSNGLYTEGFHQPLLYGKAPQTIVLNDMQVSVLPNPFTSFVKVGIESELHSPVFIELRDMYGRLLLRNTMANGKGQVELNTNPYIGGVYFLVVSDKSGVRTTVRLIKAN